MIKNTRPNAFTLIELLTVIAIIGILAAILIPTLSHVREMAKNTQCQNNIRQAALSILTYSIDFNNNRLPTSVYWQGNFINDHGGNNGTPHWGYVIVHHGFVENPEILFCTAVLERARQLGSYVHLHGWAMNGAGGNPQGTWPWAGTYGVNQRNAMTDRPTHGEPAHLGAISGQGLESLLFLLGCSDTTHSASWGWSRIWGRNYMGYPHGASSGTSSNFQTMNGRINLAFVDGHVESYVRQELDAKWDGENGWPQYRRSF